MGIAITLQRLLKMQPSDLRPEPSPAASPWWEIQTFPAKQKQNEKLAAVATNRFWDR